MEFDNEPLVYSFVARSNSSQYGTIITFIPFKLFSQRSSFIPLSHRRRGATTGFGHNRHHRSDTASRF